MVSASEFKKGITFIMDGDVYTIVDFMHVKPGKGSPFVKAKIKGVINNTVLEKTFSPTDKFEKAVIETKDMEYLYNDGDIYYFMDQETYEQIPLNHSQVEDALRYLKENSMAKIRFFKSEAFSVEPPNFVELRIVETDPGFKGDTATAGTKPATLETGAVIAVPLFVNIDDVIRIDTRTDEYMERVTK